MPTALSCAGGTVVGCVTSPSGTFAVPCYVGLCARLPGVGGCPCSSQASWICWGPVSHRKHMKGGGGTRSQTPSQGLRPGSANLDANG